MFESAEIGHKVDKATYDREAPALREALLDAQYDLIHSPEFPLVILMSGVDGAGRSESVYQLNSWLDPRHIETHGMGEPSDEERDRPAMWRFWRVLPPKCRFGVFQGSWYSLPILNRVYGRTDNQQLEAAMQRNLHFEQMLADEGARRAMKVAQLREYREAQYEQLVDAVYKRRGWDENGIPTLEKVRELGIDLPEIVALIKQKTGQ